MREEGRLLVWFAAEGCLVDTGVSGAWDGEDFVVPFRDATTAEEVGRIVTDTVRRERDGGDG